MNCAYHAEVPNVAFCVRCGRALCTECVRNVRGSVYCETCLADLVNNASTGSGPQKEIIGGTHPGVAFALGMIPGVGSIYNGDFVKAAIHIVVFGLLIQLADAPFLDPLFALLLFGFYWYMPFEAYYTAKKRIMATQGVDLITPVDRLHTQIEGVKNKELWGGIALVVFGVLFLLGNFDVMRFDRIVGRVWPVILIVAGVWFLKRHNEKVPS
jgi:hypothetical protein